MQIVLLAITVVSLLAAFVLGATAWRLAREQRARSAARVAALAAAAGEDDVSDIAPRHSTRTPHSVRPAVPEVPPPSPVPVVQAARVDRTTPRPARPGAPWTPPRPAAPLGDSFLGGSVATPVRNGQRASAIAAGILFVLLIGGGYYTLSGGRSPQEDTSAAASDARTPLELVSLRHERRDARLAITGMVRNPADGGPVEKLSAVALLFDEAGTLLTSSRAAIDYTRLVPGEESPFVITVDAPSSVARYRVSFRNDAGVVPHVDRRGQEPIARETP